MSAESTCLSLSETETLCMKAARGAGMAWGMAEEAGFAARWLTQAGFDGATIMLRQLESAGRFEAPSIRGRDWRDQGGRALCPIATGVALSDHAGLHEGPQGGPLHLGPFSYPVLILPFLALAARDGGVFRAEWNNRAAVVSAQGLVAIEADLPVLDGVAHMVHITPAIAAPPLPDKPRMPARAVAGATLEGLNALAMRTCVPASDHSRADAGSGTGDND